VTAAVRAQLLEGLTGLWTAALDVRRAMAAGAPVTVLDGLLTERAREVGE
jgi:hypothetical protein